MDLSTGRSVVVPLYTMPARGSGRPADSSPREMIPTLFGITGGIYFVNTMNVNGVTRAELHDRSSDRPSRRARLRDPRHQGAQRHVPIASPTGGRRLIITLRSSDRDWATPRRPGRTGSRTDSARWYTRRVTGISRDGSRLLFDNLPRGARKGPCCRCRAPAEPRPVLARDAGDPSWTG